MILRAFWKRLFFSCAILAGIVVFLPQIVILGQAQDRILPIEELPQAPIGIIFGASVVGKLPSAVLADRLEKGAQLYQNGIVEKLLLSGDDSKPDYHEVEVMKAALLSLGIAEEDLLLDEAGLSTQDSCQRATQEFAITKAILVTQEFHLPRALYLCAQEGIESYGFSADQRQYEKQKFNLTREFFARIAAFFGIDANAHEFSQDI